ncbi:MAG: ABC transporter permease [Pseudobdellovibrionaceae bacterium]|nr:ABC transporter permease [Pseudobdellovibrionaceae bacterium]
MPSAPFWQRLRRAPWSGSALVIALVIILCAIGAHWLAPYSPYSMNADALLDPPSASHWLGTDRFGRDVLSRLLHGARMALGVAITAVSLAFIGGTTLGMLAGYFGGIPDRIVTGISNLVLAIPEILLALTAIAILGPSQRNLILAIGIVYLPIFALIARSATLKVMTEEYITAVELLGARPLYILRHHVLTNIWVPLLVQIALSLAFAILAEAALSFLGFGLEPDVPSWGIMLREGKDWMEEAWWLAVFPGLMISLSTLSFNLLGEACRQAMEA